MNFEESKRSEFITPRNYVNKVISKPSRIILIGWFTGGLTFIIGAIYPNIDVNPAIAQAPLTETVLGILLMVGSGLLSLTALPWSNESTSWRLELVALPILVTAWLMYLLLVFLATPASLFPLCLGLAFTASCSMRFYEVNKIIAKTRKNVKLMIGESDA